MLESSLQAIERIQQPYGEDEIAILEEEVIPAIQQSLVRMDQLDGKLQTQWDAEVALLQAQRSAEIELALG